jgi:hypothetical protein
LWYSFPSIFATHSTVKWTTHEHQDGLQDAPLCRTQESSASGQAFLGANFGIHQPATLRTLGQ